MYVLTAYLIANGLLDHSNLNVMQAHTSENLLSPNETMVSDIEVPVAERSLLPVGWHADLEESEYVRIIAEMEREIQQLRDERKRLKQITR